MHEQSPDPFEKAYNRGCMWGMAGGALDQCPYLNDALAEWWHQGWEAGAAAWHDRQEPVEPGGV